jgi:hypothetical protein
VVTDAPVCPAVAEDVVDPVAFVPLAPDDPVVPVLPVVPAWPDAFVPLAFVPPDAVPEACTVPVFPDSAAEQPPVATSAQHNARSLKYERMAFHSTGGLARARGRHSYSDAPILRCARY